MPPRQLVQQRRKRQAPFQLPPQQAPQLVKLNQYSNITSVNNTDYLAWMSSSILELNRKHNNSFSAIVINLFNIF